MWWAIPAAMAAAGLVKSQLVDAPKEERDRALAAETQRYSPWTGLKANPIKESDALGSALQFGATGLGIQQGMAQDAQQAQLSDAMTGYYNRGGEGSIANRVSSPASSSFWGSQGNKLKLGDYNYEDAFDPAGSNYLKRPYTYPYSNHYTI